MREFFKTSANDTVVGENVKVTGKLHTTSNIQINGQVRGQVSSDGGLIVGKTATISGPLEGKEIKIEGSVKGNVTASELVELEEGAKVFGDIQTKVLSVKPGAIFVGKSTMPVEEELKKEEKKEEKKIEPELEIE